MSHDTWLHKISRTVIVKPLINTGITPNQLTLLRLFTGLGAVGVFLVGGNPWFDFGAGLFAGSIMLDRADGDFARITGQTSAEGHKFDLVCDAACNSLIFVGLGFALRDGSFGFWSIFIGLAAGLAVTGILFLVVRIEQLKGARAAEIGGISGFDPDDAMIFVPILIWCGWSEYLLLAAGFGAPLFAIIFTFFFLQKLRKLS